MCVLHSECSDLWGSSSITVDTCQYEQTAHLSCCIWIQLTCSCLQQMVPRCSRSYRLEQSSLCVRRQVGHGCLHVRVLCWSRPRTNPLPGTYTGQNRAAERTCQLRYAAPLSSLGTRGLQCPVSFTDILSRRRLGSDLRVRRPHLC